MNHSVWLAITREQQQNDQLPRVCVCVCNSVCAKIILISDLFVAVKDKDSSKQMKCQLLH